MQLPYQLTRTPDNHYILIDKDLNIHLFDADEQYIGLWRVQLPEGVDNREYITVTGDDQSNYYLTFENEQLVVKYSPNGELIRKWDDVAFSWVLDLNLIAEDTFYLADNNKIMLINQDGEIEKSFEDLDLWSPFSIALNSDGYIYIADTANDQIKVIDQQGELLRQWGETGLEDWQFINPCTLNFDAAGRLFILDRNSIGNEFYCKLKVYNKTGILLDVIDLMQLNPTGAEYFFIQDFLIHNQILYLLDIVGGYVHKYQILD